MTDGTAPQPPLDPADLAERKMRFLFALRSRGVTEARVLTAMERVDRIARLAAVGVETLAWMDPERDPGLELGLLARLRGRR